MTTEVYYETREAWLNDFVEAARPHFENAGHALPINLRVSIGFPSAGYRSSVIGECWSSEASGDGHFEIFLNPTTQTDARIADILTHELCHAALGTAEGHGRTFGALARTLGLDGPLRATIGGPSWFAWAAPILETLGAMPYAAIKGDVKPPRKKKKTYLKSAQCPDCGFQAWVTMKNVTPLTHLECCNPECDGILMIDTGE